MEYASFQKYCSKVVISEENFSLFPLKIVARNCLLLQNHFLKKKIHKNFLWKIFYWNMFLFRNSNPKS